jgi:hypothetical protein
LGQWVSNKRPSSARKLPRHQPVFELSERPKFFGVHHHRRGETYPDRRYLFRIVLSSSMLPACVLSSSPLFVVRTVAQVRYCRPGTSFRGEHRTNLPMVGAWRGLIYPRPSRDHCYLVRLFDLPRVGDAQNTQNKPKSSGSEAALLQLCSVRRHKKKAAETK